MNFVDELRFLKEQLKFDKKIDVPGSAENIVIAGMGGSGISGKIFQEFYSDLPVYLVDDYRIPRFVSGSTLFIAMSYSGNTEETITAANSALKKGAHLITVSSGGRLNDLGDQRIKIPRKDLQPRSAMIYMLLPLLKGSNIISKKEISNSYKLLSALDSDSSSCLSHAKRIIEGKSIPIIYGASPFRSIAYRWKTQFNENAKVLAYANSFPELNHNDTMALAHTYLKDNLYFIVFGTRDRKIKARIAATSKITKSEFNIVDPKGATDIEKMLYLIHYGDYVSFHLGLLRGVDPADVSLITELKRIIKEG